MLLLALLLLSPQKPVDGFQARTYKTMPYRLFVPPDYDKSHPYPLILWLHGAGSVGGGLRWKTIIGPIRVEYGYNLNPRPKDPTGTLLFSLGFPF